MKKLVLLSALALSLSVSAQENHTWRWGIQWGHQSNKSQWSGGMDNAHARFHENKNPDGAFDLMFRYDHDMHWMATLGMGINTYGFNFGITNNYQFSNMQNRWSGANATFTEFETPILIHYKFNLNCKNSRWVLGGGFVPTITSSKNISDTYVQNNDGVKVASTLNLNAENGNGGSTMVRFVIAREHVFKKGSMLHASWIFNVGLNDKAKATVNYTLDNTVYNHEFTNKGNFVGFRLAYFFKPITHKPSQSKYTKVQAPTTSVN